MRWKRLRYSPPKPKQPEYVKSKRADWELLKQWDAAGLLRLVYLDESGFEKSTPLTYSYVQRGQQHRITKPHRRGRRISILGFWQPGQQFEYGMVVGGFNRDRYLTLMPQGVTGRLKGKAGSRQRGSGAEKIG